MKLIRTLPIDKKGNLYYGPKTLAAAKTAVEQFTDNGHKLAYAIEVVSGQLVSAGYTGVAAKLRAYHA